MFHFPGFALPRLCIQRGVLDRSPVGCPIRGSRDHGLLAAPSSFSQLSTPFIASDRQGIHHTLFVACQISKALRDVLSAFHFNLCSGELSLRSTIHLFPNCDAARSGFRLRFHRRCSSNNFKPQRRVLGLAPSPSPNVAVRSKDPSLSIVLSSARYVLLAAIAARHSRRARKLRLVVKDRRPRGVATLSTSLQCLK
jgi:hypothetical protein